MRKKGGSSNNQTNKFIDSIEFIVPLDDNYNLMPESISKELLEFMAPMYTEEEETPLTDYESIILSYFLDDGALRYILDDDLLKGPNTMVTTTFEQPSITVGGSKKKRTKKRKSKKRKYSKKKRVQKGSGRISRNNKASAAIRYVEKSFKGNAADAFKLQSQMFGSTQQGANMLTSKLFKNNPQEQNLKDKVEQRRQLLKPHPEKTSLNEVIQTHRRKKQVVVMNLTPEEQYLANKPLPPSPPPLSQEHPKLRKVESLKSPTKFNPYMPLPPSPTQTTPPPVPKVVNNKYTVTKTLDDDGIINNFMIIDNSKNHYILSLKVITQPESEKKKGLEPYVNYDKSLHGAYMINNIKEDDLIEKFVDYGEIKGDKIHEKFKNIGNFINESQKYSYTIRNNFTKNYRSLEDVINYYEYEKVHKIPFFTRRIEKLYEKIIKIHNEQNITINDLSLKDIYISKDEKEIINKMSEDIKIITRGRSIERLASAQLQENKINDLFNVINYTGSATYCEISYKKLLESIRLLNYNHNSRVKIDISFPFNMLKYYNKNFKICNVQADEMIEKLREEQGKHEESIPNSEKEYKRVYSKYKKKLYLTHLLNMREKENNP